MRTARIPSRRAAWGLLGTVLGVACARYDLAISHAVVHLESAWAAFGQRYGELPGTYAFALAATVLYARPAPLGSGGQLAGKAPWLLCSIGLTMAVALSAYRLIGHRASALESLALLPLIGSLAYAARRRWGSTFHVGQRLAHASTWTVRLGVWSWLAILALKVSWGRVRYRDLAPLAQDFTAWYAPQGWTGHASFPSGHAASSWLLLPCLLLWSPGTLGYRLALAISVGWGVFVCSSRVVIGAHYLSDVLFSTLLAFGVMAYAFEGPRPSPSPARPQRGAETEGLSPELER